METLLLASLLSLQAVIEHPPTPRDLGTPPLPRAGEDVMPAAPGTPTILYINFDGAVVRSGCGNDAHYDCSSLANLFNGYVGPFTGNETSKMAVLQAVRTDVADFGLKVVTQRPPLTQEYSMVLYGELGEQEFAGIAPYIDCGNLWPSDTSFSSGYDTSNSGSTIVLQEAAHTWGLEHVDAEFDVMNPFKVASANQRFEDQCHKIVANTDLEPTDGACTLMHTRFCQPGYQNSWQEMAYLFGPPISDTQAPKLEIVSPEDSATFVLPVTIDLLGEIEDDLHPQFYTIELYNHGELLFSDKDIRFSLDLVNPPPGEYDLVVRIADEAGNPAEDGVRFTVVPEGSKLPDGMDGSGAACRFAPRGNHVLSAWLSLGFSFAFRRRS